MEFFQRGAPEVLYTKIYTNYLKTHTDDLLGQFTKLVEEQVDRPEKIIIVATHFGLAYQLGAIKSRLEERLGAEIFLVVQVTDDSPQVIWYVDLASLIIVPSSKTKDALENFARKHHLKEVPIEVAPYPVDLDFAKILPLDKITARSNQYDPNQTDPINIAIPVSGAAVGMEFFLHLMLRLHARSPRFVFHIVCRKAPFTQSFLRQIEHLKYVKYYVSDSYKTVVDMHKHVYMENVICAEITKPSEQSFKALLSARSAGGSFLLFAEPVGRQEHDNINFLNRHNFLPKDPDEYHHPNILRGCILPHGSQASAELIWNLFSSRRLLNAFTNFSANQSNGETGYDGVFRFWEIVHKYISNTAISQFVE